MGDGVLNKLEKQKAFELIREFIPTIRRFEAAVSILFDPERMQRLLERDGIRARENLEPCDEIESMRGLDLEGQCGSLGFTLCDPLLFLDPKVESEVWEEGQEIPLSPGPRLILGDDTFMMEIRYDVRKSEWHLWVERARSDPFPWEHDPHLSDEDNAAYAKSAGHLNEQFKRLEIPEDAFQAKESFCPSGILEYEAVIDESRARTLIPIFYDLCDAYFDFDIG